MSTTIDQRVVEMRFDNKQFESNVSRTMSTLDKLKQKLNLTGASKGLDGLNAAAKNVNMTGLGSAVETVTAKFSALQVMGVTALANITNSAVNAGKNIVKALTIDPIKTGFSEYETKLGSIQTILANTEHQGTTMNDVTRALDELNLYADKTIYNFQEMTRNIGTFTAAGVDLDTSVRSIQGIANLAAVSGSTSQQASTAMYQLSQALATGTVKLMDWNSVVNAGMGGKVFQNALIQTAAMLDKSADNVEKWQQEHIDKFGSFRDSLTQGEWLTAEVLTKTLEQFTMAAEVGSTEWEKFKKSLMDDGYTEAQAESILKMANTATDAATKVKTCTQLMDTLKESAQSGWAQSWELIIGDFEEAKEFFTGLSDLFGGILGDSANRRNTLLTEGLSSNWDKLITKINDAGVETEVFESKIRSLVGDTKLDKLIEEHGSLAKAAREGAISSDILKKALSSLGETGKKAFSFADLAEKVKGNKFLYVLGSASEDVKRIQEALNSLGYDISADGKFGKATYQAVMAFQRASGIKIDGIVGEDTIVELEKAAGTTEELTGDVVDLSKSCEDLVDGMTKKSGRELLLDSLMNVVKAIHRPLAAVGEAWRNTFSVTPEQLYGALESLEKFTSKFVMGGILDITEWSELVGVLETLGISAAEFTNGLKKTLSENGVDVDKLTEKYGDLANAFNEGAISMDIIKETLLSFDGISESMLLGGENADKVRRSFEGLFAILDIIGTVAGGGFKFAFEALSMILGKFDLNVLDLTANIGDAIVAFRDWLFEENLVARSFDALLDKLPGVIAAVKEWFSVFKQTPAVQKLVDVVESIIDAFNDLVNGDIDISEFANKLGTNLANALKSLPEIAAQVASDFIAGFTGGLGSGISGVISKVVNFCLEFVAAFAAALGVQSPSWKAYDIAIDFIQGFVNGIKTIVGAVKSVLMTIGEQVVKIFKSFWEFITDESGNVEWDKIMAGGIIFSSLWILKQFATAFSGIAEAFGNLGDIFDEIGDALDGFGKVLKAYAWDLKAKALQKMAIAIAILVASIWVLTTIDDVGKLWNAVLVIGALAGIVTALAWAMGKLSDASLSYSKEGGLNIKGMMSGLLQIGIVIALLAGVVKLIGSMDTGEAIQGFIGLAGIATGLWLFMKALGNVTAESKDISKLGGMMIKLSIAMMLLIGVVKLVDGLSPEEMGKGVLFAAAFAIFVRSITVVAKTSGNNVSKVGGMMLKLSIAMGLMVGVVKMIAKLSPEEMGKGVIFAGAFTLFVKALVKCTKIGKKQQLAKLSGLVLSISVSLTLLVGVCKLVGKLNVEEMFKGALFVAGFAIFLKALVGILKIGSEQQLAKVTGTILALSIAIGILAGVSALMGMMDLAGLAKGVGAVSILGLVMAGMVKALKGAQNVKGAVMMMAVAIGVMAAAIVALSFVDPGDLVGATAALGSLMGMFALMMKVSNKAKVSLGSITIMLGVVIVLAGILAILGSLEVGSTIEIAASIGLLMVTLGVTMQMISKAGVGASAAIGPMFALAGVLAIVAIILGIMERFDIKPSIETAASLSILLLSLAGVTAILTLVGAGAPAALGGVAALAVVVAGIGALIMAIGYLNEKFPSLQKFLDSGIPILEKIGVGIGKFVGGVIGGIGEGIMDSLLAMVETFGTVVDKLVDISANGANINADGFDGVKKLLGVLGSIGLTTVGTTLSDIFTAGGTSMEKFQTDGVAFFEAMDAISEAANGVIVNEGAMDAVIGMAGELSDLQSSLEPIGGVISWFKGRDDLATFGTNVGLFIESMKTAFSSLKGTVVDTGALSPIISASGELAKLQSSLSPIGGVISWFSGRSDLATFGTNVGLFIESMKTALSSLSGFIPNTSALDPVISAATALAKLQSSLDPIGGVISWFSGRSDLATFGTNVGLFIESMKTALSTLEGTVLNEAALDSIISAATKMSGLQSKLDPMGGVITWFAGRSDLGTFGVNIGLFADAMGVLKTKMGETGISEEVVASVSNAGNAIIALQQALPEEGWFDGKMNLSEFADYITDFGTAMGTFGSSVGEVNFAAIDTSINAANRIKTLIQTLAGLDASGVASFAGVGLGDGHLVNIGQAIGKYGEAVADLNVDAVSTSVTAAIRLRSLIASLVGLDASGIENFKVASIGSAMQSYSNKVSGVDPSIVSSSISAANRLKNFISSLVGLDTSGIANFKVDSIGKTIKNYALSVGGIDAGAIIASISAANKVKSFINGLAGLNISGIATFKTAISELSTVDLDKVVKAFSGKATSMSSAAKSFVDAMVNGIKSGSSGVTAAMNSIITNVLNIAKDTANNFGILGISFATKLAMGIQSGQGAVLNAARGLSLAAATGAESGYMGMYSTGSYLAQGLANGIAANASAAVQATINMVVAAKVAAQRAAGIASPSRVFKALGVFIPKGFALGIEKNTSVVKSAATAMVDSALSNTSDVLSKIASIVNSDIDTQPTIRPVLDLSNVEAGASSIGGLFNNSTIGLLTNAGAINSMMNRRSQNGAETEVVSAINKLRKELGNLPRESYNINGITYDDGSNVATAVREIVRAARTERRV